MRRVGEAVGGVSLMQVAALLDLPYERVRRYIRGQCSPTAEFLHRVCQVTGTSADWLLLGRGPRLVDQPAKPHRKPRPGKAS